MMNLRQCEVFRAVMEAGTVTAAAERLNVTQPAVSKMLAQLERDLGFRIFLRQRRRLVPTQEAQALYQEVRRAFVGLDHLTRFAGDLRDLRRGHLVIAASHATSSSHLPGIVAEFLRRHPGLSVSMHSMDSPAIAQAVATGRADLGVAQFDVPAQGARREGLRSVPAVCVMAPGDPLVALRTVRPADLHGRDFIALAAVNRLRERLGTVLDANNVTPRVRVDTPLASTACRLVMEGVGISILDQLSAEANQHQGIVIRPFRPEIVEDLVLLSSTQTTLSSVATAFVTLLRRSFQEDGFAAPAPMSGSTSAGSRARVQGTRAQVAMAPHPADQCD
jgi:DNA-binding transcriptional LysR family regulator